MMEMKPVVSSNISAVGYDPATKKLRVKFANGTYEYEDVSPETHKDMMEAKSAGSYFHSQVRGIHKFHKMEKDDDAQ